MNDIVATNSLVGGYGGVKITNAAAAPLGGYTNLNSWLSTANGTLVGTNALNLSWTNFNGIKVITTNATPGTVSGLAFVTNDFTTLFRDVPLWVDRNGQMPLTISTNNWTGDGTAYPLSPASLSIRMAGDASAATTLNLIFVGIPDGVNEPTQTTTGPPVFQWGVVPAPGIVIVSTNFPAWRFAGCSKLRLRSATLTTATAANIGVTIQALNLNGFIP